MNVTAPCSSPISPYDGAGRIGTARDEQARRAGRIGTELYAAVLVETGEALAPRSPTGQARSSGADTLGGVWARLALSGPLTESEAPARALPAGSRLVRRRPFPARFVPIRLRRSSSGSDSGVRVARTEVAWPEIRPLSQPTAAGLFVRILAVRLVPRCAELRYFPSGGWRRRTGESGSRVPCGFLPRSDTPLGPRTWNGWFAAQRGCADRVARRGYGEPHPPVVALKAGHSSACVLGVVSPVGGRAASVSVEVAYASHMAQCRSHHPVTIHDAFRQRFVDLIDGAADNPPETACPVCRTVDLHSGARVEMWSRSDLWASFREQHALR